MKQGQLVTFAIIGGLAYLAWQNMKKTDPMAAKQLKLDTGKAIPEKPMVDPPVYGVQNPYMQGGTFAPTPNPFADKIMYAGGSATFDESAGGSVLRSGYGVSLTPQL